MSARKPIKPGNLRVGDTVSVRSSLATPTTVTIHAFGTLDGERIVITRAANFAGMQNVIIGFPVSAVAAVLVPVEGAP